MDYKKMMIDSMGTVSEGYMNFALNYDKYNNVIVNFVEGKDYLYYKSRVGENIKQDYDIVFHPCNGKKSVELVKKKIEKSYNLRENVKLLYYCDNDYGLNNNIEGIFYTDYYSIENYYTTEEFIKKVIENIFNFNKYNPEYNICINLYKERYKEFKQQMIKVNAFCYGLRLKEKNMSLGRTELNNVKIKDFILNDNFEYFQMKNLNYKKIKRIIGSDNNLSYKEYVKSLKEIDDTKLRGKWELKFVEWFLENLKKEIKKGGCNLSKKNVKIISFDNEIMTSMERYATTSKKLIDYIKENT